MPLRLGSRRRAYKASADGNFDDNNFDGEPFGSSSSKPTPTSSSSFLPKIQNGQSPSPSPVHHDESALTANRTIDTTLESNLAPSPIKTAKAATCTDSSSPTEKKSRFKFFKRKSKKVSSKKKAKNKSKEADDDNNKGMVIGMTMLDDDFDPECGHVSAYESEAETSYGGDHTTTWEADHDDDHEAGLQVQLQLPQVTSHVVKSDALSDTGTNDDGFFAATFDFQTSSNIEFSSVADDSGFLSFEANEDWNPNAGDFQSFSHGDDGEMETVSVAKNEHASIQPTSYSTPSTSVTKKNNNAHEHESNIDFELNGPIDSDTLEPWDAKDPAAYCYNPTVSQATSGIEKNCDTRSGRNTPELTASCNTSSNSMDDDGFGICSPIDVDTLQPWAPTRQLVWNKSGQASESSGSDDEAFHTNSPTKKQSSPVAVSEVQDSFEDMWNDAQSCSFNGRDFAETDNLNSAGPGPSLTHAHTPNALPEKAGKEATSLTLGMLAQISGLADFDAVNTNQYGRSYQDEILEEEDAEAIAKAASQTLEDHEKASPDGIENSTSAAFSCTSQVLDTQFPTKSVSPFNADVSKIESSGEPRDENAAALLFNSPFEASLSRIENESHDGIQLAPTDEVDYEGDGNEISDGFAAPRALEGAFQDVENEFDTDQAEKEMAQIVSQIKGTWEERAQDLEARLDGVRTDEKNEGGITEVQKYWKEKQQQLASIHTDSKNNVKTREVNVEWPDAPASAPLQVKRQSALEDDFLSRNKNTKEWDVPSSVFTSGNTVASHVTDLSSLCEQSMDLTDDGYPVFKRKTAKEAYRASNKSVHSSNSAKGFFWRSHPEGATVEEVTPRTRSKTAEKKRTTGDYPLSVQNRPGRVKRSSSANAGGGNSEYVNFPNSLTRRASRDEEDTKLKPSKTSDLERVKSMPTQVTSNASVPWGKENLKLRNVDLSRSKCVDNPQTQRDEPKKSSPTMEWRKAIEAKIKSTSDKVRAVRTNATSPTPFTEKKPPAAPSKPNLRRAPSPFQANRNSFLNKRPPTEANRLSSTQSETIIIAGVPRTIEKRPADDDAISGCSSSMADRIKQFETKTQSHDNGKPGDNGKHGMFNRTAPLNSYALNKLRNVTSNVGGLWS